MAIFKNNQFSVETNADHTLRCEVFLQGAEEHAEELGFRGTLVALQSSLANAFHVKLDEYRSARNAQKNATSAFGEAANAVREKLR